MSASNSIHIMGRITRDLELKYTASGVAVCAFAVAVSRSYKDNDGICHKTLSQGRNDSNLGRAANAHVHGQRREQAESGGNACK